MVLGSLTTVEDIVPLDELGQAAVAATASALGVDASNAKAFSLGCGMEMAPDPSRRLTPVVRLAPAKLNLTLAIVGRRTDGYHALHSVIVPLALADRLSFAPDPSPSARDTIRVDGFDPGPPEDNLVLQAIEHQGVVLLPVAASTTIEPVMCG